MLRLWRTIAKFHFARGDFEKALALFRRIVALGGMASDKVSLSRILLKTGHFAEAEKLLRSLSQSDLRPEEIIQAMNRGETLIFDANAGPKEPSMVVPIKLRGQVIGALNVKASSMDRQWTRDEINLVEGISERLSLALENARLIQESQRQVVKEQTISDVTGKIGASINMKNVLQTAVEELGRIMPGSEILIKFQNGSEG